MAKNGITQIVTEFPSYRGSLLVLNNKLDDKVLSTRSVSGTDKDVIGLSAIDLGKEIDENQANQHNTEISNDCSEFNDDCIQNIGEVVQNVNIDSSEVAVSNLHDEDRPVFADLSNVPMTDFSCEVDTSSGRIDSEVNHDTEFQSDQEESEEDPYNTDEDSDYVPTEEEENDDRNERTMEGSEERTEKEMEPTMKIQRTRKRRADPKNWRRNVIKRLKNTGKEYKNWKGNTVSGRKLKPPCPGTCRLKCSMKWSETNRQDIFDDFWHLGDITLQRNFISKYVDYNIKSRERISIKSGEEHQGSRRQFTFVYHLPNFDKKSGRIQVCQTFFLNTLSISHQMVKTVGKKVENTPGIVESDLRGKIKCNSRLPDEVKQSVRSHIDNFQPIESHYCRKNSSKTYLPSTLNITKMYELYSKYCQENNLPMAKECIYRKIFCEEYNISFFQPKKDQCGLCTNYNNSNENEKCEMQENFNSHVQNKNLARENKENDKERAKVDKQFCAAVFDLQQVPKIEVGEAYYKRKLSTYNFTIYDLGQNKGICYMWYESVAARGACEIGSFLYMFLIDGIKSGIREFSLYSDNCAGQNRNRFIYSLYFYVSHKYKVIINHKFLESGHTQNEGDSVHSVIERASKSIPLYTPGQWYTLARTACRKSPYKIIEVSQDNVYDLKDLLQNTTINWDKGTDNEKVKWNQIKLIRTDTQNDGFLFFKYNYSDEQFSTINLLKKGRKAISYPEEYELKILRSKHLPISKEKYNDLIFFCNKNAIPKEYHNFFMNLHFSRTTNQQEDDSD
ncbi:unnamed protein product [Phaedon cochleariae]|uniref:DUF7869 domain-containing protein n=1 Tax=Phaedon cochleariae TaxID=80249 RepID=A0A9N9SBC5_PHACE|nr:unnamed protein product [Phaedon cochleariae]